MSDETTPQPSGADTPSEPASEAEKPAKAPKAKAAGADAAEKPAKAPKKEKPPALEDKPFNEFITQHFVPSLKQTLAKVGIDDLDVEFDKRKLPIAGLGDDQCWQVIGRWQQGKREFIIIFAKEDIQGPKFFCIADSGAAPSTIESFMIDERKVSLDLLLLYTVQRLNGQKWLVLN